MNKDQSLFLSVVIAYTAGFFFGFYNAVRFKSIVILAINCAWFIVFYTGITVWTFRKGR